MKKIFLSIVFTFSLCAFCFSQSTNILFHKDSHEITPQAKNQLDSLIYLLKKVSVLEELCLVGHTDSDADQLYNKKLSLNRAATVKDYLLLNGITNTIHIESKGETKLINANTTESEKALNRRVEIIQDYKPDNSFFSNQKKDVQQFEIYSSADTILLCKDSTQIVIDNSIFNNVNPDLPITIHIQEFRTKSDFILANLTTTTNDGKLIESRGMIFIEAYQNNKLLTLKKGKSIGVLFKDRQANDQTELFVGTSHNDHVVWDQERAAPKRKMKETKFTDEEIIYKKKFLFFGGKVKYSKKYWYDSIRGEAYKTVRIYNEGSSKTKRYKIATDTALVKEYARYLAKEKARTDARIKREQMDALLLNSPKLGWINCDRFYDNNKPKIEVVVKYEGDFVPNVVLVFKNINAVMPYSFRVDGEIFFENIPEDMVFEIIGLHQEKEVILFSQKEGISKRGTIETISFTKISPIELTTAIKKL